jgi:enoyl-CoA hydratase/carnithine racemase
MPPTLRSADDERGRMSDLVIVRDEANVRTLRMNRPDKKNALTGPMYQAMARAIETAAGDGMRCIVILGVPGAFCAGNDLQEFLAAAQSGHLDRPAHQFLHALANSSVPLVAGVQGVAVGVGTTMLLHCDYVVAGTDAHFSTPFVKLGLVPEAASSLLAPRLMGQRRAFAALVMGRALDAEAALACGLANVAVAPAQVDAEALKAASEIAALPPEAVAASRRLLRGPVEEIAARIDEEVGIFNERLRSTEARRAFEDFLSRKR